MPLCSEVTDNNCCLQVPTAGRGVPLASGVSRRDGQGLDALPLWPSETKKGIDEESVLQNSVYQLLSAKYVSLAFW